MNVSRWKHKWRFHNRGVRRWQRGWDETQEGRDARGSPEDGWAAKKTPGGEDL